MGVGQFSVANTIFGGHQCLVTIPRKSAKPRPKDEEEITLDFSEPARETLFFNSFWIEKAGDFISVSFGFVDQSGQLTPFFKGMVCDTDLEAQRSDLEKYLVRIGAPKADAPLPKHPSYNLPRVPVGINSFGCASRQSWGEISILQFSHKAIVNIPRGLGDRQVRGTTHGCYVSDIEIHKKFLYELLTAGGAS